MNEAVSPFQDSRELREEIIRASLYLSELGFCIGTWGNMSVRVEEGLLITPSAIDYATMTADDMVVVSWEGRRVCGHRLPSSEMQLHRLLLLHRPDMAAVIHTHSPYASACAAAHRCIPVCVDDMAQIIGGEVRCSSYVPGGRHIELAEAVLETLGAECTAALIANHGTAVLGRSVNEAVVASRVLEKAAMMFVLAESLGGCRPIAPELVKEERHRYLYKYGREGDSSESE